MPEKEEKIHWKRLKELCETLRNGEVIFKFQDGLPVRVIKAEGEIENLDLTRGS